MKRRHWLRSSALTAAAGCAFAALGDAADAQERVRWKLASSYTSNLDVLGQNILRVVDNIEAMTDGNFEIQFNEPGALVPALEVFDAVSKGSVQSSYTSTGFHAGRVPHLIFFASVPFGPNVNEYVAWIQHGGGYELYDKYYGEHNIKGFQCGIVVAESSGWFREPIETLDDLKGLKMRFFGLGAKVMGKLGVSTQLIAGADIYPALERGVIDATEFSMPNMDIDLGFYQVAKFNYYPGWHQQSSIGELLMNKGVWEALDDQNQAILEASCGYNIYVNYAETEAKNPEAMNKMLEQYGVTNVRWTDDELAAFEKAWNEVLQEQSAQDADFKRIAESYRAFRKVYKTWGDAQALKPTYLSQ